MFSERLLAVSNFSGWSVYFMVTQDDAAAVGRTLAGDPAAFEEVVGRHERLMFNMAFRMTGNCEDARDLTQQAFLQAYEHLRQYDPVYPFRAWILRIMVNASINRAKRNRGRYVELPDTYPSPGHSAEDALRQSERSVTLQVALMKLKPKYRILIELKHFQGLDYSEISAAAGIAVEKVKSRLFIARSTLRKELVRLGLSHD